jgi:hypothetical protein
MVRKSFTVGLYGPGLGKEEETTPEIVLGFINRTPVTLKYILSKR